MLSVFILPTLLIHRACIGCLSMVRSIHKRSRIAIGWVRALTVSGHPGGYLTPNKSRLM